jgi:hypothetical protein
MGSGDHYIQNDGFFFCFGKIIRWLENPIPSFAKLPWYILTLSFDNMQEMTVFQGSQSPIFLKDWKDNCQILDQVPFTVSVFGEIFHLDNPPKRNLPHGQWHLKKKLTHSCYIVSVCHCWGHYEDIAVWILDAMVIGAKVRALIV